MATKETSCPYCGANITIDDEWESAFCMFCGSEIQIKQTVNQTFYTDPIPQPVQQQTWQPTSQQVIQPAPHSTQQPSKSIVIKRPSAALLVIGIILAIINLLICFSQILIKTFFVIMLFVGLFLIAWYIYRSIKYDKDVKQAQMNGYTIKNK